MPISAGDMHAAAEALDSDFFDPILLSVLGGQRPGRFDRMTVTAVDTANRIATCQPLVGDQVQAPYFGSAPSLGTTWYGFRQANSAYVLYDQAR